MQKISRSALVPFSCQQMYALIDDISNYPHFVPHCQSATILNRTELEVTAQLVVAKSGIAKSFTTKNTLAPPNQISMTLVDGPFNHLTGDWWLKPLSEDACKIQLELNFEFSNKLTSLAFSSIFNQLAQSMVSAFTERAQQVYG